MATGNNVRVGDADREEVAAQLREHYADGRLTLEELNERLDQTFAAKTKADFSPVLRDLPQSTPVAAGVPTMGGGWQGQGWQGPGWQGQGWQGPLATRPGQDDGRGGWDGQRSRGSGRPPGAFAPLMGLVWVFVIFGSLMLFGLGGGRPVFIVLFLAAIALLKRLFALGRRRGGGGPRGPRGRRGPGRW
jgi:Domain of unknown function (DUF1707)